MKAVIDTCVILDAVQDRKPFAEDAKNIIRASANRRFTGCITAKSATDIYYLVRRCLHSEQDTRTVLAKLYKLFDVLDTAGMDVRKAIPSDVTDYEDAVMIETALREGADCIVTRNVKDYSRSPVPVHEPAAFLRLLREEPD